MNENDRAQESIVIYRLGRLVCCAVVVVLFLAHSSLQGSESSPKVLAVLAHPDDEIAFAATTYKIMHEFGGMVDVVMVTNGEGGYKYSTLAEPIYHRKLTDEEIGRQRLPFIRKNEALNGGKILGIRNYYFLEQKDTGYTRDPNEVLDGAGDVPQIKKTLNKLLREEEYDYLFVLLPTAETHGHLKAATILALQAVSDLKKDESPIILAAKMADQNEELHQFKGLANIPITNAEEGPIIKVDRTRKFGFNNRLDCKIVVNWVIAEHKSQGTVQQLMNRGDYEVFYYFELNDPKKAEKTREFLNQMDRSQ